MSGTEVKFNHNTPLEFFSSCIGTLGTTIGQHNHGGVVDDVECLLELHSSTVLDYEYNYYWYQDFSEQGAGAGAWTMNRLTLLPK